MPASHPIAWQSISRLSEVTTEIDAILTETGLPAHMLEVELTESAMLMTRGNSGVLQALRQRGVTVAIDDFGTGYSSLAYLRRFPIDRIKLAQEFIVDLVAGSSDAMIVQASIGLARTLGAELIAEGVETEQQLALLKSRGLRSGAGIPVREAGGRLGHHKATASGLDRPPCRSRSRGTGNRLTGTTIDPHTARVQRTARPGSNPTNPAAGIGVPPLPELKVGPSATGPSAASPRAAAATRDRLAPLGPARRTASAWPVPPVSAPVRVAEREVASPSRIESSKNEMSLRPRSTDSSNGVSPRTFTPCRSAPRFTASRAAEVSPRLMASNSASVGVMSVGDVVGAAASTGALVPGRDGGACSGFFALSSDFRFCLLPSDKPLWLSRPPV